MAGQFIITDRYKKPDIEKYLDFITLEHNTRPKYMAYVKTFLEYLNDTALALNDIWDVFDARLERNHGNFIPKFQL